MWKAGLLRGSSFHPSRMSTSPLKGQLVSSTVQLDSGSGGVWSRGITSNSQSGPNTARVLREVVEPADEQTLVEGRLGVDPDAVTPDVVGELRLGVDTQVHLAAARGEEALLLSVGPALVNYMAVGRVRVLLFARVSVTSESFVSRGPIP